MNQEVVISPGTLFRVLKGHDILDLNSNESEFFKHLQSDKLCLDTTNIILDNLLDQIKNEGSPEIMQLWIGLVQYITQKYYDVELQETKENRTFLCEQELAKRSPDHIWIKRSWDTDNQDSKLLLKKLDYIFYCSLSRYLNPEPQDRILRDGRIIALKKGDKFPLIALIIKCIKGSDILEIRDGYIVTSEHAIKNLKRLVGLATKKCKVIIYTFNDNVRNKYKPVAMKDKFKVEKLKEDLIRSNPRKNIDFIFQNKKTLHDRSIKTRDWFIALGAGLDRHEGNIVTKETTISISRNI